MNTLAHHATLSPEDYRNLTPSNPYARQLADGLRKLDRLTMLGVSTAAHEYEEERRRCATLYGLCVPMASARETQEAITAAVPALCSRWANS